MAKKRLVKVNLGVPGGYSKADNAVRFLIEKYHRTTP